MGVFYFPCSFSKKTLLLFSVIRGHPSSFPPSLLLGIAQESTNSCCFLPVAITPVCRVLRSGPSQSEMLGPRPAATRRQGTPMLNTPIAGFPGAPCAAPAAEGSSCGRAERSSDAAQGQHPWSLSPALCHSLDQTLPALARDLLLSPAVTLPALV